MTPTRDIPRPTTDGATKRNKRLPFYPTQYEWDFYRRKQAEYPGASLHTIHQMLVRDFERGFRAQARLRVNAKANEATLKIALLLKRLAATDPSAAELRAVNQLVRDMTVIVDEPVMAVVSAKEG